MLPLVALLALTTPTRAEEPAPPAEKPAPPAAEKPKGPPTEVKLSGLYTAWALTQQNFLFGLQVEDEDHPLDDTQYFVQMLRAQVDITKGKVGAVARLDAGQGWWGADEDPNRMDLTLLDEDGVPYEVNVYNENAMFANKDTNYTVHFDHVYGWADFEAGQAKLHLQVGRQFYGVGHGLVLDEDYDGVTFAVTPRKDLVLTAMWAKVSEGRGSLRDPVGLLMSDATDGFGDADLFGLTGAIGDKKTHRGELFAMYYLDNSNVVDREQLGTFLPNELGYARSRYAPNVSSLLAVGVSADGKFAPTPDDIGLSYQFEADFLAGRDNVDNTDHVGGLLDVNDGSLIGYNAYLDLTQGIPAAQGMDAGVVLGFGSGDADVTEGPGNVNKISTMGFFPFTNVWEDSVMPDIEGISPQGLGSPVSRGYREFENTIAAQAKFGVVPVKPLRLEASYTYLRATAPIHGFDATGSPTGPSASDLGMEVDANVLVKFNNSLLFQTYGGVFLPGEAGALLINGHTDAMDAAWEVKNVFTVKF